MQDLIQYLASLPLYSQILMAACALAIVIVGAEVVLLARKARPYHLAAAGMEHTTEKREPRHIDLSGLKRFLEWPVRGIFGKAEFEWGELALVYLFLAGVVLTAFWLIGLVV